MVGTALAWFLLVLVLVILALILGLLGFGELLVVSVAGLLLGGGVLTWLLAVAALWVAYVVVGLALVRLALRRGRADERAEGVGTRTLGEIGELALGLLALVVLTALRRGELHGSASVPWPSPAAARWGRIPSRRRMRTTSAVDPSASQARVRRTVCPPHAR